MFEWWNNTYFYYLLLVGTFLAFMFGGEDVVEVPRWGATLGILFLFYTAGDQSWKAFKRQGRAGILTSLSPSDGGHSTIHPDDILPAVNTNEDQPSLMVFATGGFVHGGVEWKGNENFVVCPPEHIESTSPAFICHTFLRRVDYNDLPEYIQGELRKLKGFKEITSTKRNIWFGMTCKRDGTSITKFLEAESKFINQTHVINDLKLLIKDKPTVRQNPKGGSQTVINIPE